MNKLTLKTLTVVFLLLLSQSVVYSQKVAVVLSGGGAKGACHVGLLKALEENDIPIDYIAGTSMGAIVAGLYAAGYSPEEMEALMTSEEFKGWAKGVIDPEYVYYYKKDPNDPSWISVPIEISPKKFKPKLPTNLVSPYEMDFQFIRIFADAGAAANYNFDSLFVPFRCVAADITANQPYIARKGNLENAIRASMTFPLYFKPITIDGHLMFDGGIFNNFPVDVVLEDFQPDYVIGSKAAGDYSIPNPDDIVSQIEGLVMNKVPYQIPEGVKGIMVAPQLIKVEVNDFSQAKSFIDSGYVATTVLMDSIKKNVSRRESKEERRMKREAFNNRKPDMFIDQVIVTGVKPAQADYIRKLIVHHPKQRLFSEMKEDYYRLITDNRFRSVLPRSLVSTKNLS
jgi:NTE family protein